MAQIRIVDDWLRSPSAGPSHWRSVMVIAEKWAEQRVLMRAYAESRDQTRPTICLQGIELAIGPAGLDVNGAWGIHIGDNADGRAQQVREHLEGAARRIAGSKGNPPRLADEESTFDREPTAHWSPGAPRMLPQRPHAAPHVAYMTPAAASRVPQVPAAQSVPAAGFSAATPAGIAGGPSSVAPSNPELRKTPLPRPRTRTQQTGALTTSGHSAHAQGAAGHAHAANHPGAPANIAYGTGPGGNPGAYGTGPGANPGAYGTAARGGSRDAGSTEVGGFAGGGRTALGYQSGSGAQSALVRLGLAPHVSARLGRFADRVVPLEFHVDPRERRVLNALGEGELTARAVGQMLDLPDAVSFMEELVRRLEMYNLDLVEPGEPYGSEPTYRLRV